MDYYKTVLETLQKWGMPESHSLAYGSTLLISLAPFLLLFLVRVENTPSHKNYLRIALSFASGGLLGDAFLHLIPHSMGHSHEHDHADHHHHEHHHEHGHDHAHDHAHDAHHGHEHHDHGHSHAAEEGHGHSHLEQTYVGLYIVSGIVLFFLIEKLLHFLKGGHSHSHSHSPAKKSKNNKQKSKKAKVSDSEDSDSEELIKKKNNNGKQVSQTRMVSGFLNLIADFLHNFTDGLAIGATFSAGKSMGSITAFTIFMHEIPHEIGDYAILIQAGYKRSSAIALQLVTAIGALIGTYVGLHYGNMEHAQQFILPVTAGGFIYIATVSVIPELLEKTSSFLQSLIELVAMFAGLAMMFWIALNE